MTEVGKISVRVSPDTGNFRRDLKNQLDRIEKSVRGTVHVDAALDAGGLRQRLRAQLAGIRETVHVGVDVDRSALGRLRTPDLNSRSMNSLGDSVQRLTTRTLEAVNGFRAFGLSAVTIAALASLVAPAIGVISGAIAALPGVLVAAVAPLGAIALGLDGIKKAAQNAGLPEMFKSLQSAVSTVFAEGLTPVFTRLLDTLPALKSGFSAVAQGVVGMADGFVNAITSSRGMAQIQGTLANIGDALSQAAPGIQDFTAGMLTLVNSFSTKLPGLAAGFNKWAESVVGWVNRITTLDASGTSQFDRAMQSLGATLQGLSGIVGDLFTKGFDWLSKPENLTNITVFFINLKKAVDTVWPVFTALFDAVVRFQQGIVNLANFAGGNWDSLTGPLQTVATTISGIGNAMSEARDKVVSSISGIVTSVISGGAQIITEVGSWPQKIKSFFADAGNWLVSAGQAIVQGLINGISQMITTAVAKAKELASSVKNAVTGFLGIHSPSRVMAEVGQFTGQGFADGLANKKKEIVDTAKDITTSVQDEFGKGIDFAEQISKGMDAGFSFGESNLKQFESDFGIGGGALSALADQGLQFGKQALGQALTQNFFTSNVDETIAVKNNQLNRQALGIHRGR